MSEIANETFFAALRRLKAIHGPVVSVLIQDYRAKHPGTSMKDAALALAGEPTYEELKAERDALAARVAALEGALRPAWEADEGATAGVWEAEMRYEMDYLRGFLKGDGYGIATFYTSADVAGDGSDNARLIAAAVNAVRAARVALGEEPTP